MSEERQEQPCPSLSEGTEEQRECVVLEGLSGTAQGFLQELVPQKALALNLLQLNWLANLSIDGLGGEEMAREIYEAVARAGYGAFIPITNWKNLMGEGDAELG